MKSLSAVCDDVEVAVSVEIAPPRVAQDARGVEACRRSGIDELLAADVAIEDANSNPRREYDPSMSVRLCHPIITAGRQTDRS